VTNLLLIGLFGGSFDPPHWGHIRAAQGAAEELDLDQLAFLPAVHPPHKRSHELTPFDLRVRMLELCLPLDPRFRLCLIEKEQKLPGTTLVTIQRLREQGYSEDRCHLVWLMGSDSLLELGSWHRPEKLLDAIDVVVLPRPGFPTENAAYKYLQKVRVLRTPLIDLSARDIRAHRQPLSDAAPAAVAQFIIEQRLYGFEENPENFG
jgi:nicotinate-nucleotide adenylyltransferase